ncbi:MAG: hypothetical protein JWM20_224 [Patescibacteria group bacterium]|nr:hypothetical protein [Patescibacteria group bacterium]
MESTALIPFKVQKGILEKTSEIVKGFYPKASIEMKNPEKNQLAHLLITMPNAAETDKLRSHLATIAGSPAKDSPKIIVTKEDGSQIVRVDLDIEKINAARSVLDRTKPEQDATPDILHETESPKKEEKKPISKTKPTTKPESMEQNKKDIDALKTLLNENKIKTGTLHRNAGKPFQYIVISDAKDRSKALEIANGAGFEAEGVGDSRIKIKNPAAKKNPAKKAASKKAIVKGAAQFKGKDKPDKKRTAAYIELKSIVCLLMGLNVQNVEKVIEQYMKKLESGSKLSFAKKIATIAGLAVDVKASKMDLSTISEGVLKKELARRWKK